MIERMISTQNLPVSAGSSARGGRERSREERSAEELARQEKERPSPKAVVISDVIEKPAAAPVRGARLWETDVDGRLTRFDVSV